MGNESGEEMKDDRMVCSDLEAAETLAGLACGGAAVHGVAPGQIAELRLASTAGCPSKDPAIAVQQFCGNTSAMVTGVLGSNETVSIEPSQPCSTSYEPNTTSKFRQNSTEAEKEERRIRRVLANRESARQTIRRRQATHLEFTKKAADLSEENKNLKKEKERVMKHYNSLKEQNEFLKLKMSKLKKPESRETQEEPKSSEGRAHSTTGTISTPFLTYNQPMLVPLLWPSVVSSSNVVRLQDGSCSLHFSMQHNKTPSAQQGPAVCSGTAGPGNPLFVLPVPWLLPCINHGKPHLPHSDISISSDYHHLSSNRNMGMETSNSTKDVPSGSGDKYSRPHRTPLDLNLTPGSHSQTDATNDLNLNNVSTPEQGSTSKKNQEMVISRQKKPLDSIAATKARRRRKELMRMKNARFHHHPDLMQHG